MANFRTAKEQIVIASTNEKHSERNEEKKDTLVPGAGVQIWRSKILEVTLLLLNISTGAYRKSLSLSFYLNKSEIDFSRL